MEIPLYVFLLGYLIYIAIFLIFSFFNLYTMAKYGFVSFGAWAVTISYIVVTLLALFVSYYYIAQVDWSKSFQVFGVVQEIY